MRHRTWDAIKPHTLEATHTRGLTVPPPKKKHETLFLSELHQMSTNFDNFWHKDGQEWSQDKIMWAVLIFHLTQLGQRIAINAGLPRRFSPLISGQCVIVFRHWLFRRLKPRLCVILLCIYFPSSVSSPCVSECSACLRPTSATDRCTRGAFSRSLACSVRKLCL